MPHPGSYDRRVSDSKSRRTRGLRRESTGFLLGSALFAVGAVPAYVDAVGPTWGAATFFAGSVCFTIGGLTQLALSGRRPPRSAWRGADAADWWSALIQFVGTLLFNVSTGSVLIAAIPASDRDLTGWQPDAWGSLAFLVSSALAIVAARRRRELWDPLARTWHGTTFNMLGSIAFAASAVGAYVVPSTSAPLSVAWTNGGTFVGAVFFFVAALLARRVIAESVLVPSVAAPPASR